MNEKGYPFHADPDGSLYAFENLSPNKRIQKLVLITMTGHAQIFNLALLDVLDTGELSDVVESNNGDLAEILVTVFHIMAERILNASLCSEEATRGDIDCIELF